MSFVIEGAIKGIAAGIGLASESIHAHIAKKAGRPQRAVGGEDAQLHSPTTNNLSSSSEGPSSESSTEPQPDLVPEANDEQIWELDAAQEELEVPNYDTISPSALEQYSSPDFPAKENEAENQSTPEKEKHTIFMSTLIANFLTRNPPPHSTCTTLLSPFSYPNAVPNPVLAASSTHTPLSSTPAVSLKPPGSTSSPHSTPQLKPLPGSKL